ncbi:hypothetical protein AUEXF2481DRAFT_572416 [Aureobasidium subglaciale EXF-2481]|uniref:Uncharacterized protein n=1 Tax=Aureobasidium subglaciale (strain EXF-2481) TaxID=1043005 RepID=A0A074Y330_AURSE|nr:uncharacterized protein AUEXF2481DRAFT_572416 [Aureobasidium subglaciale EXF-2481]KEQ90359.1 hypothetical protein AUEXF2481DRAFT_572416 [Aureobasidium subglaciale EXF-2481]
MSKIGRATVTKKARHDFEIVLATRRLSHGQRAWTLLTAETPTVDMWRCSAQLHIFESTPRRFTPSYSRSKSAIERQIHLTFVAEASKRRGKWSKRGFPLNWRLEKAAEFGN